MLTTRLTKSCVTDVREEMNARDCWVLIPAPFEQRMPTRAQ